MDASAIKELHYKRQLKIMSKLQEPLGECSLKELSNITSSANFISSFRILIG